MSVKEQAYVVFNKEGKLQQIEYGLEAVYSSYQTVTLNAGSAVVCVSKKVPVPNLCAERHTSIYRIADNIYMNITGLPADIAYVVDRARVHASSLEYSLGCTLSPGIFTRALSEKFQVLMQRSGKRAPAFAAAIFGFENGRPQLYYTDISAVEYPVHAVAAGEDYNKMTKFLDKNVAPSSVDAMVELAVSALLESIGRDAECTEVEAAILSMDGLITLTDHQVERILQTIAEKQ